MVPVPELVLTVLETQATRLMSGSTDVSMEGGRIRIEVSETSGMVPGAGSRASLEVSLSAAAVDQRTLGHVVCRSPSGFPYR
jgi:hypothetical protein